jgi:hypothetical protein
MKLRLASIAALGLAGLIAAIALPSPSGAGEGGPAVDVGSQVPALKAKTLEGKDLTLADFKGKVVFLNFFSLG